MTKIFLCYRSTDDAYAAALLDEKLSDLFGRDNVFRASRSVAPGESYAKSIMNALENCQTMLVIIGPTWRDHLMSDDDPEHSVQDDWVRIEIAKALAHNKKVIPVLLSRTPRLTTNELPPDIADLAYRQYVKFEHRQMEMDLDRIAEVLKPSLDLPGGKDRQGTGGAEFTMQGELGNDGLVELDIVQRNSGGSITGRLSGRVNAADLPRMAAFIGDPQNMP